LFDSNAEMEHKISQNTGLNQMRANMKGRTIHPATYK